MSRTLSVIEGEQTTLDCRVNNAERNRVPVEERHREQSVQTPCRARCLDGEDDVVEDDVPVDEAWKRCSVEKKRNGGMDDEGLEIDGDLAVEKQWGEESVAEGKCKENEDACGTRGKHTNSSIRMALRRHGMDKKEERMHHNGRKQRGWGCDGHVRVGDGVWTRF